MATHAHSTRTPLLRPSDKEGLSRFAQADRSLQPLLGLGLGRQPVPAIIASGGPVSRAVQAGRGETLQARRRDLRTLVAAVLSTNGGRA